MKSGIISHLRRQTPTRRRLLQALGFACLAATATHAARAQTVSTWDGGTGNWSNGGLWSNLTVPNSASADVYVDGGQTTVASVVAVDGNFTVGRLTVDAGDTVNIDDNQSLTVTAGSFTGSGSVIDNGTINVASAGNDGTTLAFTTTGSLSGTGTLNLMNNAFVYANNGGLLTIGAGFTVAGSGQLGNGSTTFTNNGTVNANVSGSVLNVRPGGGNATFTNHGLAEATGGGILQLDGQNTGTFTGGTFQALNASTLNLVNSVTVSGATLTTAGTGVINAYNGTTLTNVTSGGKLNVPDNNSATLTGTYTFTNNSTTTINSLGNDGTSIVLGTPVTLAGTGTVSMTDNAFLYAANSGDRLTVGAGVTIQGQGGIGNGSTTFTNHGLVNANVSGQAIDLRPGGTAASGADFTNVGAGLAEATGGGTLNLDGQNTGTFVGGTFQALAGSTLNIFNGALVSGATLTTAGSGVVNVSGNATLSNVTSNAAVFIPDNATAFLAGTYTLANNSTTTIASAGNDGSTLILSGPVTLAGTGTLNLTNNAFLYAANSGNLLTIGAGVTIQGHGQVGLGTTTFVNNGTVNANVNGATLDVRPSAGTVGFTNAATGLAEATGGGTLHLDGSNGTFTNNGTFAAISTGTGSSTVTVDAGALTNFAGTTLTGGTYDVISSNPANTSTLSLGGGAITTNAANVTLSGANTVFAEIAPLAVNQGSFAVANGRNFTTVGALSNTGTLVSAGGSTLTVAGAFTQSTAGTLTGNGTFAATAFTISGAVNPGGTVSATTGAYTGGAGTTTLNGDATFTVNTQFHFELGAMTGTNDHLNVNGVLNLNGTLNVTALAGFGAGVYDLVDYPVADAAYLLTHENLVLGSLPAGYTYLITDGVAGQVDLTVIPLAVPEPGTWTFLLGGAALLAGGTRLRRRSPRAGS